MIFVIWLFQIVFLNGFYRQTKVSELKSLANTISANIDSNDLSNIVTEVAGRNNICAKITDTQNNVEINVDTVPRCVLHQMTAQDLTNLYLQAKQHGGS